MKSKQQKSRLVKNLLFFLSVAKKLLNGFRARLCGFRARRFCACARRLRSCGLCARRLAVSGLRARSLAARSFCACGFAARCGLRACGFARGLRARSLAIRSFCACSFAVRCGLRACGFRARCLACRVLRARRLAVGRLARSALCARIFAVSHNYVSPYYSLQAGMYRLQQ